MKYDVCIHDFRQPITLTAGGFAEPIVFYKRVTLTKARRIVERAARRGFKRYGGEIQRDNWGSRGGHFPEQYRTAWIRPHGWAIVGMK